VGFVTFKMIDVADPHVPRTCSSSVSFDTVRQEPQFFYTHPLLQQGLVCGSGAGLVVPLLAMSCESDLRARFLFACLLYL